jgi:hypothetical protein
VGSLGRLSPDESPPRRPAARTRDAPLTEIFTTRRVQGPNALEGVGNAARRRRTLRVAPTGVPWSVRFFCDQDGAFDVWDVNLETPHVRDADNTHSADHVLNVLVQPDRTCPAQGRARAEGAVQQGRYTAEEADAIRAEADRVPSPVVTAETPATEPRGTSGY